MLKQETSLKNLIILYILWIAASAFSGSMIYLYFKNAGISEPDLVISFFFSVFSAILATFALNRRKETDLRTLMSFGIFLCAVSFVLLSFLPPVKELLFLYSSVVGFNFFLFWASFNIMYFEMSANRGAMLGFIYFSAVSLIGLVVPVLSGFIAENYSFDLLFSVSAAFYLLLIPAVYLLNERRYSYDIAGCFNETRGFRTLIFVEGIYGGGMLAALSVIPLFYFKTPVEMGLYLSVTTVFSIVASAIVSYLSDKLRRRKLYIKIFGIGLGLVSIASSLALNPVTWSAAVSIRNFFSVLFQPFTTAIISDNKQKIAEVMVARELLLNTGRILGLAAVLLCSLLLSNIHLSLVFLGLVILLYPVVIGLKTKYISVN